MRSKFYLLEDIIKNDFSIVQSNGMQCVSDARIKIDTRTNFSSLNLLTLNRSLKQFLRSLKFLRDISIKKSKNKFSEPPRIIVYSRDTYLCNLLKKLFSTLKSSVNFDFRSDFTQMNETYKSQQLIILLGEDYIAPKFLKKFYLNEIFLINKINTAAERNNFGAYKIYNSITDLKKILFLFIVVKHIIIETNA